MRSELESSNVVAAEASDADAIGLVHVRGWQAAYRGLLSDAFLDRLSPETRAEQWRAWLGMPERHVVVSKVGDAIAGFCAVGPCRDPDAAAGTHEIYALYVEPLHWRARHGTRLLQGALDHAIDQDVSTLSLWVLEQNAAARAFYESQGFVADGRSKFEHVGSELLSELRYRLVLGR